MSRRKKTSGRQVAPLLMLVLGGAGLTALLLTRDSNNRPQPPFPGEASQQVSAIATNNPLLGPSLTNQSGAGPEGDEERVVTLTAEGNQLLERGSYAEAVKKFAQAVALTPDQEDLHYNLAIALAKQGQMAEAKKGYEEALRIFPEYAEAHNNLGNLLMNENQPEEAIAHLREAVKIMPENAAFHNNLGTAFGRSGRVPEALNEFAEAVKQNPNYVEARVNLANAFMSTGRVEDAIAQLNEALRLKPGFKPALQALQRAQPQAPGR